MVRKTDAEKPPVARWATLSRREKRWTVSDVLARLQVAKEPVSESYLRAIEGGSKKPSRHVLAALEVIYGSPAPDATKEPRPEWAEALLDEIRAIRGLLEVRVEAQEVVDAAEEAAEHGARGAGGEPEALTP